MFGFLYDLMLGRHDELPRRGGPALTYDRGQAAFVADEAAAGESAWLGRGELPGQQRPEPTPAPADGTLADEIRALTVRPPASQ